MTPIFWISDRYFLTRCIFSRIEPVNFPSRYKTNALHAFAQFVPGSQRNGYAAHKLQRESLHAERKLKSANQYNSHIECTSLFQYVEVDWKSCSFSFQTETDNTLYQRHALRVICQHCSHDVITTLTTRVSNVQTGQYRHSFLLSLSIGVFTLLYSVFKRTPKSWNESWMLNSKLIQMSKTVSKITQRYSKSREMP